ncbi:FKBP-type peptidyl-prolyl cis-trans isomerase FkpA [Oxalobacteraceae bacterium GrIS 2.11]
MSRTLHLFVASMLVFSLASCGGGGNSNSGSTPAIKCNAGSSAGSGSASVTALSYVDTVVGTGPAAAVGNVLTVNYQGWLYNSAAANNQGTLFASSLGTPIPFILGLGQFNPGWDQGLVGMQAGGTRTLTIPSSLGYGSCPPVGSPIPPNSALVFTVNLVSITTSP